MRKIFLSLLLMAGVATFCQPSDTLKLAKEKLQFQKSDSIIKALQKRRDSLMQLSDTAIVNQNIRTSTDYFVRLQKENRAKKKKEAFRNIAIGISLLVVLIIGLTRKTKKIGE